MDETAELNTYYNDRAVIKEKNLAEADHFEAERGESQIKQMDKL